MHYHIAGRAGVGLHLALAIFEYVHVLAVKTLDLQQSVFGLHHEEVDDIFMVVIKAVLVQLLVVFVWHRDDLFVLLASLGEALGLDDVGVGLNVHLHAVLFWAHLHAAGLVQDYFGGLLT